MLERNVDIGYPEGCTFPTLGELPDGSFFEWCDDVYLKVKGHQGNNASFLCYSFDTGTRLFNKDTEVEALHATIELGRL